MPSGSARLHRHFLPWDRPWLPQAAAWLAGEWRGAGPLDLSDTLAIVPTRQSGRRLREALAGHAAARSAAAFPPRIHTPDTLLAVGAAEAGAASRLEAQLAWSEVLREADPAEMPDLFPVPPPRRDLAWAWRLAEAFYHLQDQLTESGLGLADVPGRAGETLVEPERWRQLAELEGRQIEKLEAHGRREPHAARRAYAAEAAIPAGTRRVVVLATPDPQPLLGMMLAAWARQVPVDIVVHAPEGEAAAFDALGRPIAAGWASRVLELRDFEDHVHLCVDPADEAAHAAAIARAYARPDGVVAVGLADPEVLPLLENALSRAGVAAYNPEGRACRTESLHGLLSALAALMREPSFEAVSTLARCPDFLVAMQARGRTDFSAARLLAGLDDVHARFLPADLDSAREHVAFLSAQAEAGGRGVPREIVDGLEFMAELRTALSGGTFPVSVTSALGLLFERRQFDLSQPAEARAAAAAEAWRDVLRECAEAQPRFPSLRASDWWEIALRLFGERRRAEDKPSGALDLQGWLELPWEDAPHLVIAGLNDGLVPEAIVGDAFLPEGLREKLELRTNAARFARDAYLLQAAVACRAGRPQPDSRACGRVDLILAKVSSVGDPLRPSRLLLRCADAELPQRIAFLFRPADTTRPNLPWMRAWQLTPRAIAPPTSVPVTGLRNWLACPFRFHLTHGRRMEAVDPSKSELDARDFGTLCHTALEAMARTPALRDCTDEKVLREFLLAELERAARGKYGERLTLPLVVQLESARQRLAKVAGVQARERQAGWVIERVETPFTLDVGGLAVRGKIDRIDRNEATGAWRVLDYKTSDLGAPPHRTHLRPFRMGDEHLPPWMSVAAGARRAVWADLQLPVYLRAVAGEVDATAGLSCGYINLPKAVGETALALWVELTPELLEAAHVCTDRVAAAIRAGEFWPPAELPPERDAFAALFHHGAADSVAWTGAVRGSTASTPLDA